jgi:metal-dependent amidase/aminoacylase/carboxypeptidase family protein
MTTLLSLAKILNDNRDKIASNQFVRLIFQPGEDEKGPQSMLSNYVLNDVDEVY